MTTVERHRHEIYSKISRLVYHIPEVHAILFFAGKFVQVQEHARVAVIGCQEYKFSSQGAFALCDTLSHRAKRAQALRLMDERLGAGDLLGLFADFRVKVAEPQPVEHLPPGIEDGPVSEQGMQRLRQDLELLGCCDGLPEAFPKQAAVLIVEAMADTIVHPKSRAALRQELPQAELMELAGVGHGLLSPGLCEQVLGWLDALP